MIRGVLILLAVYGGVGVCFAVAFALAGVQRIDARAEGAKWPFRVLILPGSALLWPVLAARWARARGGGSGGRA